MAKLSIGVDAQAPGVEVALVRPNGVTVALQPSGDHWLTDDPEIEYVGGGESHSYLIEKPEVGSWKVVLRGVSVIKEVEVDARAYTSSVYRVDEAVPGLVKPGEGFSVQVKAGGAAELADPSVRVEFIRETGTIYDAVKRVSSINLADNGSSGDGSAKDGTYGGHHLVTGYEGPLKYRVALDGLDASGNPVHRESDGNIFVRGSPPEIEPVGPYGITGGFTPLIEARIQDDAAIKKSTLRLDGKTITTQYDSSTKMLSFRPSSFLEAGLHVVEVTATDTIDQEGTPEVWTFTIGPVLKAADPVGDDHGPGYYTYPTDAVSFPAGSFDLWEFQVGHNAGADLFDPASQERVTFSVTLGALASAQRDMNQVVDIYIDTDGLSGSGRTDTLPGRNVLLASQDAWEYVLILNAYGAVLRDAAGGETSLALEYLPSAKSLVAYVPFSRLGLDDPAKLSTWGYAVLVMGRDGLNAGGVKEVTTLGGAAAFGGGSEGSIDPGVIDLLAPSGMTQEAMLSSYSIPEGRRATISAFRFGGSQGLDTVTPVISGVTPFGAWAIDPPTFACTVSDDRGVDPASITLTVDGVEVAHELLSISGSQRRKQVSYAWPSPFGGGEHVYSFAASDLSGNRESETRSFAIGTVARLALICGRGRQEGMVVGGDCRVEGTALGQSYFVESSPDGVSWATVAQGTANIVSDLLGSWPLGSLADGPRQLRLRVLHPGGEVADSLGLVIDNTAPSGGIELVGGAAASSEPDIKGVADLVGMAADVHFKEWILEAGEGSDPSSWRTISGSSTQAPSGTLLASWNTSGVSDFSWTLRLTAEDAAGNRSVKTAYVHVDNTPPRASIIAPASGASVGANTLAEVTGDVYDARLGAWTLEWGEGSAPAVWQSLAAGGSTAYGSRLGTWDTAGLVPGSYSLRLTAQDKAGSVVTVSSAVTLTAAPMARISGIAPASDEFVKGTVQVNGTASFPAGGSFIVEVSSDGVTWTQVGSGSTPVTDGVLASWDTAAVADNAWTIRLTSLDGLGGTASSELAVSVDNTLPSAAITSPIESANVTGKAEISGTADDANLAWYKVEWGVGATPGSWASLATFSPTPVQANLLALWETNGLEVGPYSLRLTAADKAGNTAETVRSVVINTDTIPPAVALDAPVNGEIVTATTVEILGSVSDTALLGWSLAARPFVNGAWGTETILVSGTAQIAGLIHAWDVSTLDGKSKLTLAAWDASGNRSEKSAEIIFVHTAPYAAIESVGALSFPAGAGSGSIFLSGLAEIRGTAVAPVLSSYIIEASIDGAAWSQVATGTLPVSHGLLASWDTTLLGDADYHLRLRVIDASLAEASDQAQVPLDNLPPTVSLTEPGPNASAGSFLLVRGTASDAHFREYLLEVASAQSPEVWMPFMKDLHPVTGGVLGKLVVNADVAAFKEQLAVGGGGDLLWAIVDMETSADGRIFVSEDGKSVIRVYGHQGEYLYDIGGNVTEPGWSMHPMGIFVKGAELFVADRINNRVQVFDLEGAFKRAVALPWDPAVDPPPSPYDVAVADDGRMYVVCDGLEDIRVLSPGGEQLRVITPVVNGVSWPARGLMDIDAGGNIYAAAATKNAVMKLSPEGEFLRSFGERGTDVV